MRKITADKVYPVTGPAIEQGVVIVGTDGEVLAIDQRSAHDPASLEQHQGVLIPGLINAHCHLELSHMKAKVATGTGLIPFITNVVKFREVPEQDILDSIQAADREMYDNGIVAVGDISNKLDTAACKDKSDIRYYTFVEMFDFLQDAAAEAEFTKYFETYKGQSDQNGNNKSCVPHAPYSVSASLFQKINQVNEGKQLTVSIHNQETPPENELFLSKTGGFIDFYGGFGISLDQFQPTGQASIHYALQHMDPRHRSLFVHNTLTTVADIQAAHAWSDQVYWVTCPNANLYIENRLPNYQHFLDTDARLTIGTDSLTSNWQLSILEEMKSIQRYQSYVTFEQMLSWACLNGANALGYGAELGSLEVGKKPGVLLLKGLEDGVLQAHASVQRLA
ncbi:MAG: amidohydrolase family protein [Bacteroidota bacterium]